jgi:hypothetical protein
MQTTGDIGTTVPSKQADLRNVPLAEMPALSKEFGEAPGPVLTDGITGHPVPVAAFSSAI